MKKISSMLFVQLILVSMLSMPVYAQGAPEGQDKAVETAVVVDNLGRDTPRGAFKGFLKAVSEEKYDQASEFMNLTKLSRGERAKAADLASNLQLLMDRHGWMRPDGALNDKPEGDLDDEYGADVDNVASLRTKEGTLPINVERITDESGRQLWLISSDLVAQIPALAKGMDESLIDKVTMGKLTGFKVNGAPFGHWLVMLALYCVAYLVSGFIVRFLIRFLRRIFRKKTEATVASERNLMDAFELPLRLYAMVLIASLSAVFIGVSALVRHAILPVGMTIVWVSIGLFLWGIADLLVSNFNRRMAEKGRYNMTSTLAFVRRGVKVILFVIILIFILDSYGVDVTAGLAALGIGGIALALGAQKTLENFIGSLSIIIDQPIFVGDFCKIGETTGTVEDIGMRSTRIRTNDRTLVTIPNGDLSTQRIENFARRSRFLMNQKMVLRYDATSANIRDFMAAAQNVLDQQPKVLKEGVTVRLLGFNDMGYSIQVWCNIQTDDYNDFLKVQADIVLGVVDAAKEAGVYFAIPSQTFLPAVDQTGPLQKLPQV